LEFVDRHLKTAASAYDRPPRRREYTRRARRPQSSKNVVSGHRLPVGGRTTTRRMAADIV